MKIHRCFLFGGVALGLAPLVFFSGVVAAGSLNDTGIDFCGDDSTNKADCAQVGKDSGSYPRQDALSGRDALAASGALVKVGAGAKGFDYTKVSNSGAALAATAKLGGASTDWACTRDNVTGLLWEVKTISGLRSQDHAYTWFNGDSSSNGGSSGTESGGTCSGIGRCDTEKYVADVNALGLCGNRDWRLPNVKELEGLADLGRSDLAIDSNYFPNTPKAFFWSASPFANYSGYAWGVYFADGFAYNTYYRSSPYPVRLVRGVR